MRLMRVLVTLMATALMAAVITRPMATQAAPPEEIAAKIATGLEMSAIPTPVTEALEAAAGSLALAQWFCDPETCTIRTNYKTAAKPVVPPALAVTVASLKSGFNGPVSAETAALLSAVLKAQLLIAADELAVRETLHRRYTAEMRKDEQATALQKSTLDLLVRKAAADKKAANGAWGALAEHLKAKGIDSKPNDTARTLAAIKANGFPRSEMTIFGQLGLSAADIKQMHTIFLQYADVPKTPKSFAAAIPMLVKINDSNTTLQQCTCAPPDKR